MSRAALLLLVSLAGLARADPVLPAEALAPPARKILAERDAWARPMRSELKRQRFSPNGDFTGVALVDILAGDDGWELIAERLDEMLKPLFAEVRYLDVGGVSPLTRALEQPPVLLVLGSTRRITESDAIAVAHFVALGGRLLAIAHASPAYPARVADYNVVLGEFGMTVALARPRAPTVLEKHPITEGLSGLPALDAGVGLWGLAGDPVARAGSAVWMCAVEEGAGRVVVVDGRTLSHGWTAKRKTPPGPSPFAGLVQRAVTWLMAEAG